MSPHGPPEVPRTRSLDERERARREREARRARLTARGGPALRARLRPPEALPEESEPLDGEPVEVDGHENGTAEDRAPERVDRPAALPRLPRPHSAPPAGAPPGRGRGRSSDGPGPAPAAGGGGIGRWTVGLLLVALLGAAWIVSSVYQPFGADGEGAVRVVIPKGASVGQIGKLLDQRGVISSPFFFKARVRLEGRSGSLKPGAYNFPADASFSTVLARLDAGVAPDVVTVTVPEGGTRREVAPLVAQAGLGRGYLEATEKARGLDPTSYGADQGSSLEGFLYPDTYELRRGSSPAALVRRQLGAFRREFPPSGLSVAGRNESPYEVLTVASMIEREALVDAERPVIASVIYNRLDANQKLGIDATVRFVTRNWTRPILKSELELASPYNTYTNFGLPPGPIGNPGKESIEAAVRPASTDYRFYVVKPGTCGEHKFSETDQEWARDKAAYDAERARRGGRSPTDC